MNYWPFSSLAEYEAYYRCISKASVGDALEFYTANNGYPSAAVSAYTQIATVLGKVKTASRSKYHATLIFGSVQELPGFWRLYEFDDSMMPNSVCELMTTYKFAFYGYITDVRIKYIFKKPKP